MGKRFVTTDPDEARGWLAARPALHRVKLTHNGADLHLDARELDGGRFALHRVNYTMAMSADGAPYDPLVVAHLRSGHFRTTHRKELLQPRPGETFVYPDTALTLEWESVQFSAVVLDRAAAAAQVAGVGATITVVSSRPISVSRAFNWHELVRYTSRQMTPTGTMVSPLVQSAAFQLLAATFTQTFPCRISTPTTARVRVTGPAAVVRRAISFIETHARQPLDVATIAAAARIGPRGLQLAFRLQLDTTPMAYLRRVRLELAHYHLTAADPNTTTVKAVAAQWGWSRTTRFVADYQAQYGRSPMITLQS